MSRSYDVAIVGGGIVGAACASEFAQSGLRVALIERDTIGGAATAAAMGHIAVMDDSPAQFALTRYSQLLWKELAARLPADAEYLACGAIWLASNELELAEVLHKHCYYSKRETPTEILTAQSLAQAEPNLRDGMAGGLWVKDDAVVNPPCVAKFLASEAQHFGAELILGRRVMKVEENTATLDDRTEIDAERFVVANGVAAAALVSGVKILPRKGHLVITDRYPDFVRHQLIELGYLKSAHASHENSVAFNVQPRSSGQLLIGSSRQNGAEDSAVELNIVSAMLRRAFEYMPGLRRLSVVRSWTGLRAATPDKLPLIGLAPGTENVYLATGHEGLGITTCLGTAKLLASMILNREAPIPPEPYSPGRLALQA